MILSLLQEALLSPQHLRNFSGDFSGQHRTGPLMGLADSLAAGYPVFFLEPGMQLLCQVSRFLLVGQDQAKCHRPAGNRPADAP